MWVDWRRAKPLGQRTGSLWTWSGDSLPPERSHPGDRSMARVPTLLMARAAAGDLGRRALSRRLEADLLTARTHIVRVPPTEKTTARRRADRQASLVPSMAVGSEIRLLVDCRESLVQDRAAAPSRLRLRLELEPGYDSSSRRDRRNPPATRVGVAPHRGVGRRSGFGNRLAQLGWHTLEAEPRPRATGVDCHRARRCSCR